MIEACGKNIILHIVYNINIYVYNHKTVVIMSRINYNPWNIILTIINESYPIFLTLQ